LRDLIQDWKENGREILKRVAREQPGTYMKVMAMLMPRELKVESTQAVISGLSDEQLRAMIHELQERIAKKLEEGAKVINGKATEVAALPAPSKPWRPRRTRKAAKALKAITADCETKEQFLPSSGEEPLK
jgi:pyruvate-formate lyase-activating enzyme